MNTADIRDMNKQQWVFWATAIPVTITVIGLSLFVIRYFEPAREALGHFWSHGRNEEQILTLPAAPPLMDQPRGSQRRDVYREEVWEDAGQPAVSSRRRPLRTYEQDYDYTHPARRTV